MRDKYANMSPFMRKLNQNAGFIVVGTVVVLLFFAWTTWTDSKDFYEDWGCMKIENYMIDDITFGYTPHDALTEEQHLELHTLYTADCVSNRTHEMP